MKRPMCVLGASLLLSTWAAFFFSARQSLLLSLALLLTGLLVAAVRRVRLRPLCVALLAASVAFALHARYESAKLAPFAAMANQIVPVHALVTDSYQGTRTIYYTLYATFPGHPGLPDTTVRLRVYGDMEFVPGDALRANIRLNPKEQPAAGLRLAAENYVEATFEGIPARVEDGFSLRRALIRFRGRLWGNVYDTLHSASADVVAAMVLGMRDNLSSETYSAVNRAGTSHLLAISGLHLSIIAAIALKGFGRLPLSRRAISLLAMLCVVAFAVLVGFSASIIRSAVMTVASFSAAAIGRRRGDALSSLGFAAALICLFRPDWVLGRGLWLSAGATLGIVLYSGKLGTMLYNCLSGRGRLYNKLVAAFCGVLAVSGAASVFTMPLLVVFSGWVSLIAPLSNLLVTPFVPVVIGGGMLCAAFGTAGPLMQGVAIATDFCTAMVLQISRVMADLPFATIAVDQGWMLLWFVLLLAVLAVLAAFRAGPRLAGYAALLLVLSFAVGNLSAQLADRGKVELAVIEGCDTAVLLSGGDAVLLGTPQYYEISALLRYLEYRQVDHVRAVLATDQGEQIGSGLPRLAARYPVDCVVGPNDAYILGQLALAMPEIPVYSGGYARLSLLGGAQLQVQTPGGDLLVSTGNNTILKTAAEYAIIENNCGFTIAIHPDGMVAVQGARGQRLSPVGALLFGERRWVG